MIMPEKLNDRTIFSLLEVTRSIQKTLSDRYASSFWIKAEMNKLNHYPQSGHCYPDLVEKTDGRIVAEMRSTIWKDDFQRINDHFQHVLHEPLKNGIKILFCAQITFSPVYGLSLRIIDIDPSWSLGELEKEKQQTIEKLHREGIFNANKALSLPLLPKRIAVISVETSKGYADFHKMIVGNEWGYRFFHMLFTAVLQGENAVESIIGQLEKIRSVMHHFDAVAIIRGGGGDIGLACYNNYLLSRTIALFPLPVITGIGHSTNETVAEMVAFKNAITPTELADFLIQKFHNFTVPLHHAQDTMTSKVFSLIQDEMLKVLNTVRYFRSVTMSDIARHKNDIRNEMGEIRQRSRFFIQHKRERDIHQHIIVLEKGVGQILMSKGQFLASATLNLAGNTHKFIHGEMFKMESAEKNVSLLDPVNILNRGYSITLANGKGLKSVEGMSAGVQLTTILADGTITSTTSSVKKTEKHE